MIILVGLTIAVGFAAWAWISSSARQTESNLGNSINENFVIANANFSLSNMKKATISIYNAQSATMYLKTIIIQNSTWSYTNSTLALQTGPNCSNCFAIAGQTLTSLTLNVGTPLTVGSTYSIKAQGQYGTVEVYSVVR
jgi:hypothetical protein